MAAAAEQVPLIDAGRQQLAPVLAEPRLGVTLGREGLRARSLPRDLAAVGTFVPPCPCHVGNVSGRSFRDQIDGAGPVVVLSLRNRPPPGEAGPMPALTRNRRPRFVEVSRNAWGWRGLQDNRRGMRGGARAHRP